MKILGKNVELTDFVPPISYKVMKVLGMKYTDNQYRGAYYSPRFKSFSQYNEDLVIDLIFKFKNSGFYIDIGANDPSKLNNTKRFYDRGWRGINIEPDVSLAEKVKAERPEDTNLNIGITDVDGEMTFYEMSANTLSSFNKDEALRSGQIHGARLLKEHIVKTMRLETVLAKYTSDIEIDFLSVDTEGYDLKILESNNWEKFRPKLLLVEINHHSSELIEYIHSVGYETIYQNHTNGIYADQKIIDSLF